MKEATEKFIEELLACQETYTRAGDFMAGVGCGVIRVAIEDYFAEEKVPRKPNTDDPVKIKRWEYKAARFKRTYAELSKTAKIFLFDDNPEEEYMLGDQTAFEFWCQCAKFDKDEIRKALR